MRNLFRLQQTDLKIKEMEEKLQDLHVPAELQQVAEETRTRLANAEAELKRMQTQLKNLELDLASKESQKKDLNARLYSGRIVNPKELAGLQKDFDSIAALQDKLEEKILELMDRVDEGKRTVEQHRYLLQEQVGALDEATAQAAREKQELEASLADMKDRRGQLVTDVDETLLRRYEQLRQKKEGLAVVGVIRGTCRACGMALAPAAASRLSDGHLETCKNCGRMLMNEHEHV